MLVGAAGYFVMENKDSKSQENKIPNTQNTNVPTPVGWNTYTSVTYGFKIDHPSTWKEITDTGREPPFVTLDGGAEGKIVISFQGDNLNFSDVTPEQLSKLTPEQFEEYKLDLDEFMEITKRNKSMTVNHISLNDYNAYEVTLNSVVSVEYPVGYDGPKESPAPAKAFSVLVENSDGVVFGINFTDRGTKNDLTPTEQLILSTFQFSD